MLIPLEFILKGRSKPIATKHWAAVPPKDGIVIIDKTFYRVVEVIWLDDPLVQGGVLISVMVRRMRDLDGKLVKVATMMASANHT